MSCSVCSKKLNKSNKCGFCYAHRHLSAHMMQYQKLYRRSTAASHSLYHKEYRSKNRQSCNAASAKYKRNNPAKRAAIQRKRELTKTMAAPKWLTKDHLKLIEMKYQLASYLTKETGTQWEVDHIIPLQGKNVRGLHVPWNLRVITEQENCSKHNKVG